MRDARVAWEIIKSRAPRRITGISFSAFGISWEYGPNERKVAEEVVTYIENTGIFYAGFEWEHPRETYNSASSARAELNVLMRKLDRNMPTHGLIQQICDALRDFQRQMRRDGLVEKFSKSDLSNEQVYAFDGALVRLRNVAGAVVARFAINYKLSVAAELDQWLHPAEQVDDDVDENGDYEDGDVAGDEDEEGDYEDGYDEGDADVDLPGEVDVGRTKDRRRPK
jgi:hypothetical protein